MIAFTRLALNTRISAASTAPPAKTTVSAAMAPKPTAARRSLLRAGPPRSTHLTPGPRASGPPICMQNGGATPALRKRVLGSREARDVGCLLSDEFEERRLTL